MKKNIKDLSKLDKIVQIPTFVVFSKVSLKTTEVDFFIKNIKNKNLFMVKIFLNEKESFFLNVKKEKLKEAIQYMLLRSNEVIVQEMINDSDYSGYATIFKEETTINIAPGLIFGLIDGHVTPKNIVVSNKDFAILKIKSPKIIKGSFFIDNKYVIKKSECDISLSLKLMRLLSKISDHFKKECKVSFTVKDNDFKFLSIDLL